MVGVTSKRVGSGVGGEQSGDLRVRQVGAEGFVTLHRLHEERERAVRGGDLERATHEAHCGVHLAVFQSYRSGNGRPSPLE